MTTNTFRDRWARIVGPTTPAFTPQTMPLGPPAPPTPNTTLTLDSTHAYLQFTVILEVSYTQKAENLASGQGFYIAQAAIRRRAADVSQHCPVTQPDRLRADLAVALRERRSAEVDGVLAWAACTEVRSSQEDRDAMERYEETRRRLQTLRWQGDVMDQQMRQLRPLLTDPLQATAWWFAHNQDRPADLPETARTFRQLAALLRTAPDIEFDLDAEEDTGAGPSDSVGRIIDDFDQSANPPARQLVAHQMSRILADHGHLTLADRMRRLNGNAPADPSPRDDPE